MMLWYRVLSTGSTPCTPNSEYRYMVCCCTGTISNSCIKLSISKIMMFLKSVGFELRINHIFLRPTYYITPTAVDHDTIMTTTSQQQQQQQQHVTHQKRDGVVYCTKIFTSYSLWIGLFVRLFMAWFLPWMMDQNPRLGVDYTDIDLYVFFCYIYKIAFFI